MHNEPLIYFRTKQPGDITPLEQITMTGKGENRVTNPRFLKDQDDVLTYNYRTGGPGNSKRVWNRYDTTTRTWSRLLEELLLDREGARSAYPMRPVTDDAGWFHLVWVWRDTPDCATNNHLSYARSRNLIHWESAFGEPVELPIRLSENALWIDSILIGGGIINGCEKLFIDEQDRPIVSYHKSDSNGNMQIFAARAEGKR